VLWFHIDMLNLRENVILSILTIRVLKREYWPEIGMYVLERQQFWSVTP